MPRHGENIYKRRDGRYEGRDRENLNGKGPCSDIFMATNIRKYCINI